MAITNHWNIHWLHHQPKCSSSVVYYFGLQGFFNEIKAATYAKKNHLPYYNSKDTRPNSLTRCNAILKLIEN